MLYYIFVSRAVRNGSISQTFENTSKNLNLSKGDTMKKLLLIIGMAICLGFFGCAETSRAPNISREALGEIEAILSQVLETIAEKEDSYKHVSVSISTEENPCITIFEWDESHNTTFECATDENIAVDSGFKASYDDMEALLKKLLDLYIQATEIVFNSLDETETAPGYSLVEFLDLCDVRYIPCPYFGIDYTTRPIFIFEYSNEAQEISTEYSILSEVVGE